MIAHVAKESIQVDARKEFKEEVRKFLIEKGCPEEQLEELTEFVAYNGFYWVVEMGQPLPYVFSRIMRPKPAPH